MRIAINGFGRIGRTFLRTLVSNDVKKTDIHIVAINVGPVGAEESAYVFKYDSIMGTYPGVVEYKEGYLFIGPIKIKIIAQTDATQLPWMWLSLSARHPRKTHGMLSCAAPFQLLDPCWSRRRW